MEGTKPGSIDFLFNEFAPWYPVSLENPHTKKPEPTWWVPFAKQQAPGTRVIAVTISVSSKDDPAGAEGVSEWWGKITDLPVDKRGTGQYVIMFANGVELRFVDAGVLFEGAEGAMEHLKDNTAIAVVDIGCVKGWAFDSFRCLGKHLTRSFGQLSPRPFSEATATASHSSALKAITGTDAGTWTSIPSLGGTSAIQAMGTWFRFHDLPEGSTRGLAVPAAQARL